MLCFDDIIYSYSWCHHGHIDIVIYYTGTIYTCTQTNNKNTDFCCWRSEMKNKETHHGGFQQQQSLPCLVDRYKYVNIWNDGYC